MAQCTQELMAQHNNLVAKCNRKGDNDTKKMIYDAYYFFVKKIGKDLEPEVYHDLIETILRNVQRDTIPNIDIEWNEAPRPPTLRIDQYPWYSPACKAEQTQLYNQLSSQCQQFRNQNKHELIKKANHFFMNVIADQLKKENKPKFLEAIKNYDNALETRLQFATTNAKKMERPQEPEEDRKNRLAAMVDNFHKAEILPKHSTKKRKQLRFNDAKNITKMFELPDVYNGDHFVSVGQLKRSPYAKTKTKEPIRKLAGGNRRNTKKKRRKFLIF
jgi:hypothetical protein